MEATVFEVSQDRDSLGKESVLGGGSTRANAELREAISKDFSSGQHATFNALAWELFLFSDRCKQADEVCFREKTNSGVSQRWGQQETYFTETTGTQ